MPGKIDWRTREEQARAAAARKLIAQGKLHPLDGLAMVVWPPSEVRQAEREVPRATLIGRIWRDR